MSPLGLAVRCGIQAAQLGVMAAGHVAWWLRHRVVERGAAR